MTDREPLAPWLKSALELGPVLAFLAAYVLLREREIVIAGTAYDGFIIATGAFVPLIAASTFALWRLTGAVSRMQIVTAVLVIVFGGLTVAFNDERFIKIKPTIIYLVFAGLLGLGLLRGQSYLQYVLEGALPLTHTGWMLLTGAPRSFCGDGAGQRGDLAQLLDRYFRGVGYVWPRWARRWRFSWARSCCSSATPCPKASSARAVQRGAGRQSGVP